MRFGKWGNLGLLLILGGAGTAAFAATDLAISPEHPRFKVSETLVSPEERGEQNFLAFPALAAGADSSYWISHKRGYSHGSDAEALLEAVEWSAADETLTGRRAALGESGIIFQMGEWIRFPDGRLATFIDSQDTDDRKQNFRVGIRWAELNEASGSFSPVQRLGAVDGIEYGYLFDSVAVGDTVYAIAMTFEVLAGNRRSVDVIRTSDNGKTWSFVRNLSEEFGDIRINESSLIPFREGFLIATRGYDNLQRLHEVDREFRLIRETDLTGQHPFIDRHIGRPRLFEKDDRYYLIGRNFARPEARMEMALFEINPGSLHASRYIVLDNREQGNVRDGYYPCPFFTSKEGEKFLNVIDYKALGHAPPSIVRFQFRWSEIAPSD